jgi:hypothetical protein
MPWRFHAISTVIKHERQQFVDARRRKSKFTGLAAAESGVNAA